MSTGRYVRRERRRLEEMVLWALQMQSLVTADVTAVVERRARPVLQRLERAGRVRSKVVVEQHHGVRMRGKERVLRGRQVHRVWEVV